jgi:hypothetical protein
VVGAGVGTIAGGSVGRVVVVGRVVGVGGEVGRTARIECRVYRDVGLGTASSYNRNTALKR